MSVSNGKISSRMGTKIAKDGVSGDLQKVFNSTQKRQAWYFEQAPINIYSKHKPFRSATAFTAHYDDENSPRELALRNSGNAGYAISVGAQLNLSVNFQNPYWQYMRPRGISYNELYRAEDFEQYNHLAEVPLLTTNKSLNMYGQIDIDLFNIINRSSGVELSLTEMFYFPEQDYWGFILWDTTRKFGYKAITNVYVGDVVDDTIPQGVWSHFAPNITELPFLNGDVIEFIWATHPNNTVVYDPSDPDGRVEFVKLSQSDTSGVLSLVACDETHGRCLITITKLDLSQLIFAGQNMSVSGAWNSTRSSWSLSRFAARIQCSYSWPRSAESYPFSWEARDNEGVIFFKNVQLSAGNAMNYYDLVLDVGQGRSWSIYELIDNNYEISFEVHGEFTGSGIDKLFARITYNVNTGTISWTT